MFYEGATLQVIPLKWKLPISKDVIQVLSLGADVQAPDKLSHVHLPPPPLPCFCLFSFFISFFSHLNARDLTHHIR